MNVFNSWNRISCWISHNGRKHTTTEPTHSRRNTLSTLKPSDAPVSLALWIVYNINQHWHAGVLEHLELVRLDRLILHKEEWTSLSGTWKEQKTHHSPTDCLHILHTSYSTYYSESTHTSLHSFLGYGDVSFIVLVSWATASVSCWVTWDGFGPTTYIWRYSGGYHQKRSDLLRANQIVP